MQPRRAAYRLLIAVCFGVASVGLALAAEAEFPRFKVTDVQTDCEAEPEHGAKLCTLAPAGVCFTMPPSPPSTEVSLRYKFALDPRTERLSLAGGGSWVFFSATFSACGSGSLERVAVLRFAPSGEGGAIANLMPYVAVTNVSDRAMWSVPSASAYPVYVQADFVWGKGESHFGEHFFEVEAWRFDPTTSQYARVLRYRTARRYDGGDRGQVRVLAPERAEILRRLGAKQRYFF